MGLKYHDTPRDSGLKIPHLFDVAIHSLRVHYRVMVDNASKLKKRTDKRQCVHVFTDKMNLGEITFFAPFLFFHSESFFGCSAEHIELHLKIIL